MYLSPGNLNPTTCVTSLLMEHELRTQLEAQDYLNLVRVVSQSDGVHNEVFTVIDQMPARTVKDYENIIARLRALPTYIDQTIDLMREQLAAGLAQPAIVVDLTLDQIARAEQAIRQRSRRCSRRSDGFRRRSPRPIRSACARRLARVRAAVRAGWKQLETFLRDTYRPQARPQTALGSAAGRTRGLRRADSHAYTTTRMTAEQIHQIGSTGGGAHRERDGAARARRRLHRAGHRLREAARRTAGHAVLVAGGDDSATHARCWRACSRRCRVSSSACRRCAWTSGRFPPIARRPTASNYTAGTADGARPAWFNMNTYRPQEQVKYAPKRWSCTRRCRATTCRWGSRASCRACPSSARCSRPRRSPKGWALYAESLGPELGVYARSDDEVRSAGERAVPRRPPGRRYRAFTRWAGRATARASTSRCTCQVSRWPRSIATSPGRARRSPTSWGELKIVELRRKAEQSFGAHVRRPGVPRCRAEERHAAARSAGRAG